MTHDYHGKDGCGSCSCSPRFGGVVTVAVIAAVLLMSKVVALVAAAAVVVVVIGVGPSMQEARP